eukprot:280277-Pelagomonas_calceolata.AAC.2
MNSQVDVRLGMAGLEELAVVDSSFEDPTGSQAARRRGRSRSSGTRQQALCAIKRQEGQEQGYTTEEEAMDTD